MINYKDVLASKLYDVLKDDITLSEEDIKHIVEVPTDEKMGDYAFPCFRLAKELRKAPPMIAEDVATKLQQADEEGLFVKVENVNAYVNVYLSREAFAKGIIEEVNDKQAEFGKSDIGTGKTVVIDYSSPNIAKPFHIGHIRTTVIGNAIYKLYDALGYKVVRINHLGDYGTQFGKMISAYKRWGCKEDVEKEPIKTLLSYYTKFHREAEKDPALDDEARAYFVKLENGEPEEVELWQWFRDESLKEFKRVYDMLDIEFDSYAGESFYSDKIPAAMDELKDKGLLKESQGATVVDFEDDKLGVALIAKSDGSTLYITRDIATVLYRKRTYDFDKAIYVVATQQNLHFKQLFKIVEMLGYDWADKCVHVPFGMVSTTDGALSTRKGIVVFLEDVLNKAVEKTREIIEAKGVAKDNIDEVANAVGIGAVVFNELSNNRIKDYVFDWDQVLNFDGETGPYVQYTHARACSLLRKADDESVAKAKDISNVDTKYVTTDEAYGLLKLVYNMPSIIKEAADKYEPSIVTRHIVDIAQAFNRFYNAERIITEDCEETISKLAIVNVAITALRNGLNLLGVKAPEVM